MLINQCKDQVEKFGQLIKSATIVGGGQLTPAHLKECEKQKNLWQKRLNGLKKLKTGLETSGRPHAPSKVSIYVHRCTHANIYILIHLKMLFDHEKNK